MAPPRRPRRTRTRVALAALALLAGLVVAGGAFAYLEASSTVAELSAGPKREVVDAVEVELDVPPKRPLTAAPARELEGARTILLVGSDGRWGEKDARADTMALLRIDPKARRVALLSVPRDLYVAIPGHGRDRINKAYEHGGTALLTRTVRETLGVEINHFVEVDFRGFRQLVGELGGVYLPVDQRYFNRHDGSAATNYAEIDLRPGYQLLDADDALSFVRYRHGDSDIFRAARQQLFLREAARQVVAQRYDVLRMRRLIHAFASHTTSDIDDLGELWRLVDAVREARPERTTRLTVPATELIDDGAYYLQVARQRLRATVERWHGGAAGAGAKRPPAPAGAARQDDAPRTEPARPRLVPDARARTLLSGLAPACVPSALPAGFRWPDGAARRYELHGHATVGLYATRGSGRSLLWTMTRWGDAPALDAPTGALARGGRSYDLWFENGRLRQIAWREGDLHVWITNTLRNEVPTAAIVELAESCRG